jgi:DNA-directed RNA polymerase subunit beta
LARTSKAEPRRNGNGKVPAVSFSKLPSTMAMPNMLDVQLRAFRSLLQTDAAAQEREDVGLERVFNEVFPITDVNNKFSLEFVNYSLGEPKYSVEECIERDMTYAAPLKATLRLVVWEEVEDEERRPKDIIEKEVYLGDLPLLTTSAPSSSTAPSASSSASCTARPAWSSRRRAPERLEAVQRPDHPVPRLVGRVHGRYPRRDLRPHRQEEEVPGDRAAARVRLRPRRGRAAAVLHDARPRAHRRHARPEGAAARRVRRAAGRGGRRPGDRRGHRRGRRGADARAVRPAASRRRQQGEGLHQRRHARGESPLLKNTLRKDPTANEEDALRAIYSLLRPGDPPNIETARVALERIFFNPKRYDLGRVGRYKINQRLGVDMPLGHTVLTQEDFIAIIRYLIELNEGRGFVDDIDHLGNRRIRSVGELIANQFSVGLSRMARLVKERMSITTDVDKMNIDDLVNARTVSAVIQAFFGSSQLSQFMDQTNPLAELTHKRRLSALGPGGLTRERAGFEVRDVHYSHYGRMCPIETPEGPNIGLISSLTTFARVNDLGFIETPYRKVIDGKVTDDIVWLDANAEEKRRSRRRTRR